MKTSFKNNLVATAVGTILAGVASLTVAPAAWAGSSAACPPEGYATAGCDVVITLNPNGSTTISNGASSGLPTSSEVPVGSSAYPGTYDNSDDTLIGVVNNSGHTVDSIHLSGSTGLFGFDSDGIGSSSYANLAGDYGSAHGASSSSFASEFHSGYSGTDSPTSSYDLSGPLNSFSDYSLGGSSGNVDFGTGLVNGGSAFFSLEGQLSPADFTATSTVPEPGSLAIFAAGLAGLAGLGMMRRRRKKT